MSDILFKHVDVGEEFGYKDYFFTKVDEEFAEFSGDLHRFAPDDLVCAIEEDFLAGYTCNPDAPEECESCQ